MKKLLLLFLSAICLGACSVDNVEMETVESQITVMDASFEVDGCSVTTFNYADAGRIEVRNDPDFIYIKIVANSSYEIDLSYLHIAADLSGFPITGNKNNPGISAKDMTHKLAFTPRVKEYTWKFPVDTFGDSFFMGAYTVFQHGNKKHTLWAGDISGNGWSYLQYHLNEHPFYAGTDKSREISLSEAQALQSWDDVRKAFTSMLDAGVPEGQFIGSFQPSIWEIINRFNDPFVGGAGEYSTVYTLGEGDCTDSVLLTLNVVPDSI